MPGGDRSTADGRVLAALVGGATREQAAELACVSVATVYRRLRDVGFRAELEERERELVRSVALDLALDVSESRETLRQLRDDPEVPANVRVTAADRLLQRGLAYLEHAAVGDLAEELAGIKRHLGLTTLEEVASS